MLDDVGVEGLPKITSGTYNDIFEYGDHILRGIKKERDDDTNEGLRDIILSYKFGLLELGPLVHKIVTTHKKPAMVMEKFDGNLYDEREPVNFFNKRIGDYGKTQLQGLHDRLGQAGYFNSDISASNLVFKKVGDETLYRMIDFDMRYLSTIKPANKQQLEAYGYSCTSSAVQIKTVDSTMDIAYSDIMSRGTELFLMNTLLGHLHKKEKRSDELVENISVSRILAPRGSTDKEGIYLYFFLLSLSISDAWYIMQLALKNSKHSFGEIIKKPFQSWPYFVLTSIADQLDSLVNENSDDGGICLGHNFRSHFPECIFEQSAFNFKETKTPRTHALQITKSIRENFAKLSE